MRELSLSPRGNERLRRNNLLSETSPQETLPFDLHTQQLSARTAPLCCWIRPPPTDPESAVIGREAAHTHTLTSSPGNLNLTKLLTEKKKGVKNNKTKGCPPAPPPTSSITAESSPNLRTSCCSTCSSSRSSRSSWSSDQTHSVFVFVCLKGTW